jgi:hypothetical protein
MWEVSEKQGGIPRDRFVRLCQQRSEREQMTLKAVRTSEA